MKVNKNRKEQKYKIRKNNNLIKMMNNNHHHKRQDQKVSNKN